MNIYESINKVMADIGAVGKTSKNTTQGFMFRGIDAVMNAISPALIKNKVFVVPEVLEQTREERTTAKGSTLIYSVAKVKYTFFAEDGTSISATVIGEGMDSGDKSMNKAMSIAFKYACFQVFCIPTEEMVDPDYECHEVSKKESDKKDEPKKEETLPISVEQLETIKKEMERTGITEKSICSIMKCESIESMNNIVADLTIKKLKATVTKKNA